MKNPLVIALLLLAVLGGAVWYTSENPPATEDEDTVSLIDVKDEQIAEVTVRKPGQEPITVTRAAGEEDWSFGGGLDVPADDAAIGLMVTNLANLNADRVVNEETTDWSPYGLEGEGSIAVDVRFRDLEEPDVPESKTIIFGRESPTGSGVYARIEGDPRLYTVYNYVKSTFDKEVFDWRDKKLLQADEDSISRVKIDLGDRQFEFGKSGESDWQILEPKPLRADNFTVGDLARSLSNAAMTSVVAEGEEAAAKFSFDKPLARAEIVDEAGAHELTVIKDGDRYLARSSDMSGVYEVPATFAEGLDKQLEDFREKKLFGFGFAPLEEITVRDGDVSATLAKKEDKWALTSDSDREVSAENAQTLIDALRNLSAIGFPSDNPASLDRFGLKTPAIEAEALSADEGAKPEKVLLSDPSAERVYATRSGEASVYEVEKAPAQEIRRALEALLAPAELEENQTPPEEQ